MLKERKNSGKNILTFAIGDCIFALPIENVVRVEQAAALTPLPGAPDHVAGLLNHHGTILPVIDIRPSLGAESRDIIPDDQYIIIKSGSRNLAIIADRVVEISSEYAIPVAAKSLLNFTLKAESFIKSGSSIIMLTTPEKLLEAVNLEEVSRLISQWNTMQNS